jgi:hypothetical protein
MSEENETLEASDVVEGGLSAFEQGKAAGETGSSDIVNPFSVESPDHHHFETGRKFGSRAGRGMSSSHWQRRKA